jgi:putative transposase
VGKSLRSALLSTVGTYFHLYNRGVDRRDIFLSRDSYLSFEARIATALNHWAVSLLAYCLTPNHFHFLVRQNEPYAISWFMKEISFGHSLRTNQALRRHGHLLHGRYKPRFVDSDDYLLQVSRYIHLNPVDAGLVKLAWLWEYSSCLDYCGKRKSAILDTSVILSKTGGKEQYIKLLDSGHNGFGEDLHRYLLD